MGLAQLMVILDVTVVNIALPSAQQALGFSDADRQWVVTAYTLAFGGLLLLAGRLADLAGRKRRLLIGLSALRGSRLAAPHSPSACSSSLACSRACSARCSSRRRCRC